MADEGFDPIGWMIKIGIAIAILRSCASTDVEVKEVKEAVHEVQHDVQILTGVTKHMYTEASVEQQKVIEDLEVFNAEKSLFLSSKELTPSEIRKKLPSEFTVRVGCPRCSKMVDVQDTSMLMCPYCQYTLEKGKDY